MDPWAATRLRARACAAEAMAAANGRRKARALVEAAVRLRDLEIVPFEPGTRFAKGILGVFERVGMVVHVDATLRGGERDLVLAHELGHVEMHGEAVSEVTAAGAAGPAGDGTAQAVGYSPRERREVAADHFAAEFLCPSDWLAREMERGRRPREIAATLGVPLRVVIGQALRAALLPPLRALPAASSTRRVLDETQARAATWSGGPLLIEAGPGTGKTSTLIGRVGHLLGLGVPASRILVLTYGVRAAAEAQARVAAIAPDAADDLWVGTFHSFGLEVITGWHQRLGRAKAPRVLDRDGCLELLERRTADLPLRHHRHLRDPVVGLAPVLDAIMRCKDEMIGSDAYAAAVREAAIEGDEEASEAAAEVAAVYAAYADALVAEDAVDMGDLVMTAAGLMEEHDDVASHYGERFLHVLVDEYQDVNAASIRLLQALCGPGTALWAVGDPRQSVYRFRGAGPDNVAAFADVFGGETTALGHNYRARAPIVAATSTFTRAMRDGAADWRAHRGGGDPVLVLSAATLDDEATALRDRIDTLRAGGVGHGDQVVLARTHRALDRIGGALERLGVPLLHLGDLLARDEVRHLLAALSIGVEPGGLGLLRIAVRVPYDVPRDDVLLLIRHAVAGGGDIVEALTDLGRIEGIGDRGRDGLTRLARDLARFGDRGTAWSALASWSLERDGVAPGPDVAGAVDGGMMRRAAVWRLVRLAADHGGDRRTFLAKIRRAAALGGGHRLGGVPPEAEHPDAVRLSTLHGAKGLEFAAVHVAMAGARQMPLPRRPVACPPPPDLAHLAGGTAGHDAEERCLWFVGLSRARDHLTISHAVREAGRTTRPSPFIGLIGAVARTTRCGAQPRVDDVDGDDHGSCPASGGDHREVDLATYMRCPARYRFEVVDGLAEAAGRSGYGRFRAAVRATIRRLEEEAYRSGADATGTQVAIMLGEAWEAHGPRGHGMEGWWREVAGRAAVRMAAVVAGEAGATHHREEWAVDVGGAVVRLRPDRVVERSWGRVSVQELRFAGRRSPGKALPIHALLLEGARRRFPDLRVIVESLDPETGEAEAVDVVDADELVEPYRRAIVGVEKRRFAPTPGRRCPSCPFLFACGG